MTDNITTLHFIGGGKLDVLQAPDDVARMLWSDGGDARDMGYAALQQRGGESSVLVNPAAVAYVASTASRSGRATFS